MTIHLSLPPRTAVLFLGHGSRDPEGVDGFQRVVSKARDAAPWSLQGAFLEFGGGEVPSIQQAIDEAVASGAERVLAVPLLLLEAGHARRDMPAELALARTRHPAVDLRLSPPLGPRPEMVDIVEERLADTPAGEDADSNEHGAAILVAAGSSNAEGNADFYRLARLVWERRLTGLVEPAFMSVTRPSLQDAIDRCARLGARHISVVPYFISPGRLPSRTIAQAREAATDYPEIRFSLAPTLGPHPRLIELALMRVAELAGEIHDAHPSPRGLKWQASTLEGHHHHHKAGHSHAHP